MIASRLLIRNITNTGILTKRSFLGTLTFESYGLPENVLSLEEAMVIAPPVSGEIQVSIQASQVTPEDIRMLRGYSHVNNKLGIAGTTAVAKVKDVGSTSSGFSRNDLVLVVGSGLWCDVANVPATNAFKIGDLSDKDAAMLPSALSAWGMLNNFVNLSKENIVVHTLGGSSTGIAISQLGAAMGLQVFSPSKTDLTNVRYHETVRSAGPCKLAISARNNKISTMVVKSLTENGVMVLCNDTLDSFDAINGITIPVGSFIFNNNALAGFNLHSWMNSDPATFRSAIVDCVTLINQKVIEIPGQVYSIKDYKKAFNDSYDGKSTIIKI